MSSEHTKHCPNCAKVLRTPQAQQCFHCGHSWHGECSTPFQPQDVDSHSIPTKLRRAIARSLSKPIHLVDTSDFPSVTELAILSGELDEEEMSAIAKLKNLRRLDLTWRPIATITPLGKLLQLQVLRLPGCGLSSLQPLQGMVQLNSLDISRNQVADVSPLAELSRLQSLSLAGAPVCDIRPLSNLQLLEDLNISWTEITDLSVTNSLSSLRFLNAEGTKIREIPSSHSRLESLNLNETPLSDIDSLNSPRTGGLTRLRTLSLEGTAVTEVRQLMRLPNLEDLRLDRTNIQDLSPLGGIKSLKYLSLVETGVATTTVDELRSRLPGCEIITDADLDNGESLGLEGH